MELRPYQEAARAAVWREWEEGRRRTLVVQPTGTGKTVTFSAIAADDADKGGRVLVLAHRGELLDQAAAKIAAVAGLPCAVEKASDTAEGSLLPVTVGSVQTLMRQSRLERFSHNHYTTIIIDEAHHALSDGYRRILDWFDSANVLGVTATPDRGDKRDLGQVFDSLAYEYTMPDAIRDGYLCPIMAQTVPLQIDLSGVGTQNGDYKAGEAGEAVEPYLEAIADEMIGAGCRDRKTVAFLPLVSTSQKFRDVLEAKGFRAAEVNGNSTDRVEKLAAFDRGEYDVLCNSMLLTEGWDCPNVDCVVVLRPTKVRGLYCQMVGRGTRIAPGKDHLLLLDFLWLVERHELCRPASLVAETPEIAKAMTDAIEAASGPVEIGEAEQEAAATAAEQREAALAKELAAQRKKKARLVDPLQYAVSINAGDLVEYQPAFGWEMLPPTDAQIAAIEKMGVSTVGIENRGKAAKLMDRLALRADAGLATPKQIRCLEKYGFVRVGTWSKAEASRMIDRVSMASWRVPRGVHPATYRPGDAA